MRLVAFILSFLLLGGAIDAETSSLVVLAIVAGAAAFRLYPWRLFVPRPVLDVRMASFVLALLLAAGAVDATKDWLIAMSAVSGVAAFFPGIVSLEEEGRRGARHGRWGHNKWRWDREPWR
jgi:hypothetical protein